MPSFTKVAGIIAGLFVFVGTLLYVISIIRRKTVPNRATWCVWAVVGIMLGYSYYASGARDTMWVPIVGTVGPIITLLLCIKYGEGGWSLLDRNCLIASLMSLIVWAIFRSPVLVLTMNLVIDSCGALPTIKKTYYEPHKEDRAAWVIGAIGNTINLFAVEHWTFAIAVYPVYAFLGTGTIALLTFRRKKPLVP